MELIAKIFPGVCCAALAFGSLAGCSKKPIVDEARAAGKTTADFPKVTADVFAPMDRGSVREKLSPQEIMGRNTWLLWSAGNEHFWNSVAQDSYGLMDLLKMLDNRKYPRGERFKRLGLVNEPGFKAPTKPDEFGLWLDAPTGPEPAGIDEKVYGKPSGVLGFRLFPNPDFDEKARRKWDGERFANDPAYYNDNTLVRPYRVGVSCGSCHIAPNPVNPPADPENPKWENLSSAIGNQYINEGRVFACNVQKGGLFNEMIENQPRGTSDTSRIATDHINNPNAINPIFLLAERQRIAATEKIAGGALNIPGEKMEMAVPHILKDGADSVGVPGATIRVYVNIGLFSQYWLSRHNRLIGLTPQKPFEVAYAQANSVFWRATEERVADIAAFFKKLQPLHLADAPGGADYITRDEALMAHGKMVFAESCAECHSSKQPPPPIDASSGEGRQWLSAEIVKPDFLANNFLSTDRRYPISKIETNASRAMGTNAMRGHVWDNFSSETYKNLPAIAEREWYNPFDESRPILFTPYGGGPGYYRVPSLVSVWSSAPFFNNNALGKFTGDPSVAGRMEAFNDAVQKLLWPEKRLGKASIWRTENECSLQIRKEFLPAPLQKLADADGFVRIGPIPKGTPVNLLANLDPNLAQLVRIKAEVIPALVKIKAQNLQGEAAAAELRKVVPALLDANKCPDFIEDKGHYFGCDLPNEDKLALIEYLKTL
ncbi:MAG: hypothetical protein PHC88_06015 [Terrimicrobiaceae bacterium]|nr:hypothetical protein [Terrimicrobiaceae bacterium]